MPVFLDGKGRYHRYFLTCKDGIFRRELFRFDGKAVFFFFDVSCCFYCCWFSRDSLLEATPAMFVCLCSHGMIAWTCSEVVILPPPRRFMNDS